MRRIKCFTSLHNVKLKRDTVWNASQNDDNYGNNNNKNNAELIEDYTFRRVVNCGREMRVHHDLWIKRMAGQRCQTVRCHI